MSHRVAWCTGANVTQENVPMHFSIEDEYDDCNSSKMFEQIYQITKYHTP